MRLSPRWISLFISLSISVITVVFLQFVPGADLTMMFITGITSFLIAYLLVYYVIDVLVFQEVNKIYDSLRQLKDAEISKKSIIKSVNPLKKLKNEISHYVLKKEEEIDTLKKMETFRREFLADVSHDLKTPIFAAQGFIHTLLDGAIEDPEVSQKFLKKAAKSLDGLEVLVKDILILTQVESGDIRMHFERIDLKEVVEEVFEQLESKAKKRDISLHLKAKDPVLVYADRLRISQVLTNLVSNGITYGKPGGKVAVNIKGTEVKVSDNGIGISEEHLPRVFERFYRVDKSRSRAVGGTGLGLAIVKHILNAHNASIDVISKLGEGTTFTFTLSKPENSL